MQKVLILDRDGTINVDHGYVYRKEDWQFTPGAPEALKLLQDAGFTLAIATGQSGIGRGIYTEADMHALHAYMNTLLAEYGVSIKAIAFCPHTPQENCQCRKPGLAMFTQLQQVLGPIDRGHSWMVGDKLDDVRFGQAAGLSTVLLKSRYWSVDEMAGVVPTHTATTLYEAVLHIIAKQHSAQIM